MKRHGKRRQITLITLLVLLVELMQAAVGCRPAAETAHVPVSTIPRGVASPDAATGNIRFVDIAEPAGLHYRWTIPGKRPLNLLQTIGNGCALLDVDNDGNLDILLVGPKPALYKGDGKGHFMDVTAAYGLDRLHGDFLGCAVGDYDNDGYEDIYLTAYRGGVLLHNEGGRRFKDVTAAMGIRPQPWGTSAAFADVDGDGKLDLYIANYVRFGSASRQLCLTNQRLTACGPIAYAAEKGVLYRNLGGRFRDVTREWGADQAWGKTLGAAFADYDDSGRPSLALANDEMPGNLLRRQSGRYVDVGVESGTAYDRNGSKHGGMGVDWGDYDNDGRLDLLVATYQQEVKNLYRNDGGGFTDQAIDLGLAWKTSPYVAFGAKFLDVDNDGWLDIMFTNGHTQDNTAEVTKGTTYRQPTLLFRNQTGQAFSDAGAGLIGAAGRPIVGRGLAIGDFDNDGRIDVLVVDSEGAPLLLHNETSHAGHWSEVRLRGTRSNRDGIGALVTFETPDRKLLRLCHTDGSYMSASDRRIHCGLGAATRVTIRVRWPDGRRDAYQHVPVDRVIELTEGGRL
jgi:hypothetical protein